MRRFSDQRFVCWKSRAIGACYCGGMLLVFAGVATQPGGLFAIPLAVASVVGVVISLRGNAIVVRHDGVDLIRWFGHERIPWDAIDAVRPVPSNWSLGIRWWVIALQMRDGSFRRLNQIRVLQDNALIVGCSRELSRRLDESRGG